MPVKILASKMGATKVDGIGSRKYEKNA